MAPKPGVVPLRPLTLSDIFEGAMRTIRGNPGATLGLALAVSLLITVPMVLLTIALYQFDPGSDGMRGAASLIGTDGSNLVQSVAGMILAGMLVIVVSEAVLGRRMSIGQAWNRTKGRIWAILGVSLINVGIIAAPLGLAFGVFFFTAGPAATLEEGFLALAILALTLLALTPILVFLWVKLIFAVPVAALENQGPIASIKRSWQLTRGQWWRTFGISLLAAILVGIVSSILVIPVAATLGLAASTGEEPGLLFIIALQGVTVVITALTAPFTAGVTSLQYIDQRIRKEALDVTLIGAAQDPRSP